MCRRLPASSARFLPDGSGLNSTFGTSGHVITTLGTSTNYDQWTTVQSDGKHLYLAGWEDGFSSTTKVAVMRFNTGVVANQTLYFQQDANFNVTSVTNSGGEVLERYGYTPYGEQVVYTADHVMLMGTGYEQRQGFQGLSRDPRNALTIGRFRYLHETLGFWTASDPKGYVDGMHRALFVRANPLRFVDPMGTQSETPRKPYGPLSISDFEQIPPPDRDPNNPAATQFTFDMGGYRLKVDKATTCGRWCFVTASVDQNDPIEFVAVMIPSQSFFDPQQAIDLGYTPFDVLRHEQIHFGIANALAGKYEKQFNALTYTAQADDCTTAERRALEVLQQKIRSLRNEAFAVLTSEQARFDREVGGTIGGNFAEWEAQYGLN